MRIDFTQIKADCLRIFAENMTAALFSQQEMKSDLKRKVQLFEVCDAAALFADARLNGLLRHRVGRTGFR
jgi:hypothetical protein